MAKITELALEIGSAFSAEIECATSQTGRTHKCHVRTTAKATAVAIAFDSADGGITISPTNSKIIKLTKGATLTELINLADAAALWVFDVESMGATADDKTRVAVGTFLVTRDITRTTEATPAASALGLVAYSEAQTLTAPQQLIARTNIGAGTGGATDAVLFTAQTLTAPQQAIATTNISAATVAALASHTHLLAAGATDVTVTAANLNTLDDNASTALHFHDTDRARANHTGAQALSTLTQSGAAVGDNPRWSGAAWVPAAPSGGMAIGGAVTGSTAGSIPFIGTGAVLAQSSGLGFDLSSRVTSLPGPLAINNATASNAFEPIFDMFNAGAYTSGLRISSGANSTRGVALQMLENGGEVSEIKTGPGKFQINHNGNGIIEFLIYSQLVMRIAHTLNTEFFGPVTAPEFKIIPEPVGTLPTPTAGRVKVVNDATSTTRRSVAAGAGANVCIVMADGTNWLIV